MQWITAHWVDIIAAWGGIYTAALVIVKLTPTPRDNKALERINGIVTVLSKLFGLNPYQGTNTKPTSWRPRA